MVILKRDRGSGTAVPHLIQPNIIQQQMRFGKSQLQKSTSWECVNSQKMAFSIMSPLMLHHANEHKRAAFLVRSVVSIGFEWIPRRSYGSLQPFGNLPPHDKHSRLALTWWQTGPPSTFRSSGNEIFKHSSASPRTRLRTENAGGPFSSLYLSGPLWPEPLGSILPGILSGISSSFS